MHGVAEAGGPTEITQQIALFEPLFSKVFETLLLGIWGNLFGRANLFKDLVSVSACI
jgi:hypothetical protein